MIGKLVQFVVIFSVWASSAVAGGPYGESYGPTELELKMLPPYCQDPGRWRSIVGPDITFNNHTCYGINRLNRYYRGTTPQYRRWQLTTALADFTYSVDHLKPDFKLMPEIYYYRGVTYQLLARNGEAMADLIKAINLDPKLARAYGELADIYEYKLSRRDKALEIVTDGLRHNPEAKELQRRYTKLGGRLPYPEPLKESVQDNETKSANDATTATEKITPPVKATASGAPDANGPGQLSTPTSRTETPKIGSPSDPYCRFCPD